MIHQDKSKISCDHSIYKCRNRLLRNHNLIPELQLHNGVQAAIEASGLTDSEAFCNRITMSDVKNASRASKRAVKELGEV